MTLRAAPSFERPHDAVDVHHNPGTAAATLAFARIGSRLPSAAIADFVSQERERERAAPIRLMARSRVYGLAAPSAPETGPCDQHAQTRTPT
jgi:hypothetical protein